MSSPHWPIVLIEVVLVFGGVLVFAWWQLRDVERARRQTRLQPPSPPATTSRIAAVLLAAGVAERMGGRPKALLERDGVALVRRVAQALADAGVTPIVVVTGHHAAAIERALEGLNVVPVRNPTPESGQVSSQRQGLQAVLRGASVPGASDTDAILVALADQPLLSAADVQDLIEAFRARDAGTQFVVPWVGGEPANPVIFSLEVAQQILADEPETGGRQWRSRHPERVMRWATDNHHYRVDVDTLQDLHRLEQDEGVRLHWPAQTEGRPP